jgi:ribonuclease-3
MHNVYTTADRIEAMTGYTFTNKLLCAEAAQMASPQTAVVFEGRFRHVENNKRLAILGDTVLQKVLCAAWFETYDTHGRMSYLSSTFPQI